MSCASHHKNRLGAKLSWTVCWLKPVKHIVSCADEPNVCKQNVFPNEKGGMRGWANLCPVLGQPKVWSIRIGAIGIGPIWSTRRTVNFGASKIELIFLKIPASFLFLFVFTTVNSKYVNFILKSCRWLDSNLGPLASEATVLTTEPQPLPKIKLLWCQVGRNVASGSRALLLLMRLSVSLARWSSRSQWSCKSSLMESFWPKSRFLSFELTSFFVNFNKW